MNKWMNDEGMIIKSATRPDGKYVYPVVSESRVSGSSYTPYVLGSKEWRDAANRALANIARGNFERNGR
jgi:hypothetical protein